MRLSEVDICNAAIALCGMSDFIQSLDDTSSVTARRCNYFFIPSVERVLRKHNWACATEWIKLAENATAPTAEYDYSFAIPFDCVRMIDVYSDERGYNPYLRWRIVGRDIHTDAQELWLKYVAFPEDYRSLDVLLATAISYELAIMLSAGLIKDPQIFNLLRSQARIELAHAKAIDTLESKALNVENDTWDDARMSVQ